MKKLIIIRGLPGSGKSTKAKELLLSLENSIHFEADMFHMINDEYMFDVNNLADAHKWCQSQTVFWLHKGSTVIVSNTFTTMNEMKPYFEMAKKYSAEIEVIEMENNYGSIHNVPTETIDKMKSRWENY